MKINDYINEIVTICRKHDVARLSVFGSVLTDQFNASSDIDFLVMFQNQKIKGSFDRYFNLKEDLESLLNQSVDLVCEHQISNPYFKKNIDQTKQVLYAA